MPPAPHTSYYNWFVTECSDIDRALIDYQMSKRAAPVDQQVEEVPRKKDFGPVGFDSVSKDLLASFDIAGESQSKVEIKIEPIEGATPAEDIVKASPGTGAYLSVHLQCCWPRTFQTFSGLHTG